MWGHSPPLPLRTKHLGAAAHVSATHVSKSVMHCPLAALGPPQTLGGVNPAAGFRTTPPPFPRAGDALTRLPGTAHPRGCHWPAEPKGACVLRLQASFCILSKVQITHRLRTYERVIFPSLVEALDSTRGFDRGPLQEAEHVTGRAPGVASDQPPLVCR